MLKNKFNKEVKDLYSENVKTFMKEMKEGSYADIWGNEIPHMGNSMCKGPKRQ